jgi:beta-mannosidase
VCGLRNHPSLIAWCGGNEINPRREKRSLRTIQRVLEREDPARPWIPASPAGGDIHQWDVWHGGAPWQALSRVTAPFMSEFGLQALPHVETIREMFPSGVPASLDDAAWAERKLQVEKLRHYAGPAADEDWVATVVATQRTQAVALQVGIEACRLRREGSWHSHPCGGVVFWQFNEPWPVVSWSVVDQRGRPKAAYEMLMRSYNPLLIAARFEWQKWHAGDRFEAEICVINDTAQCIEGCTVEMFLDGRAFYACEGIASPAGSARCIGAAQVVLEASPSVLELTCSREGVALAVKQYDLSVYLPPRLPVASWLVRRAADLLLQVG